MKYELLIGNTTFDYREKLYFRRISWSLASALTSLCSRFSPWNILPVVKLFACLGVYAYLVSNERPNFQGILFVQSLLSSTFRKQTVRSSGTGSETRI